jgi:hypothetical protein
MIVQDIGDFIKWRISIGQYPNGRFLGVKDNILFALPLIDDNRLLNQYIDTEWCFERLGPAPSKHYAVREVSSGRYWSPRVAFDLSAIELSANRTAWEVLSTDGLSVKIRLANSYLAIASQPEVERAFLFEESVGTLWAMNPSGSSRPPILTQPMLQQLAKYKTIFLIDDSPSMFARPWAAVTEAVAATVDKAIQLSAITKFDLHFVDNFRDNKESLKSGTEATNHMATIRPSSNPSSTIREAIEEIVNQAISETGFWNVIILTDATRTEESQPTRAVTRFKKLLKMAQRNATTNGVLAYGIGVQLVQFNSSVDFQPVKTLNQPNNPVYFDTVNYSAPLTDEKLQKILLGAIDPDINQTSI